MLSKSWLFVVAAFTLLSVMSTWAQPSIRSNQYQNDDQGIFDVSHFWQTLANFVKEPEPITKAISKETQYQNDDQSILSGRTRKRNDDRSDILADTDNDSDSDKSPFQQHLESCHQHIPCGFAQYGLPRHLGSSRSRSSRFKPIFKYTRSYCKCDSGNNCVLTDNRPDMDMYMFHCRQREISGHMFKFPNYRG